ncbi:hypothetical protein [Streptomyces regalis]|uniref:hypothetical protein n=1 Tax=Streptomyces regalis TaxID=68262 RepID=UPI000AEAE65A|nr:hypothetical protein [Streptomyces regalis]
MRPRHRRSAERRLVGLLAEGIFTPEFADGQAPWWEIIASAADACRPSTEPT